MDTKCLQQAVHTHYRQHYLRPIHSPLTDSAESPYSLSFQIPATVGKRLPSSGFRPISAIYSHRYFAFSFTSSSTSCSLPFRNAIPPSNPDRPSEPTFCPIARPEIAGRGIREEEIIRGVRPLSHARRGHRRDAWSPQKLSLLDDDEVRPRHLAPVSSFSRARAYLKMAFIGRGVGSLRLGVDQFYSGLRCFA
jgi:hypothetical protein